MATRSQNTQPVLSVPPREDLCGPYAARLVAVRRFPTAFGPRMAFELELLDGQPGERVVESAAVSSHPKGKLADIIRHLSGRVATAHELEGALQHLIGTQCRVTLTAARNRSGKPYLKVNRLIR